MVALIYSISLLICLQKINSVVLQTSMYKKYWGYLISLVVECLPVWSQIFRCYFANISGIRYYFAIISGAKYSDVILQIYLEPNIQMLFCKYISSQIFRCYFANISGAKYSDVILQLYLELNIQMLFCKYI